MAETSASPTASAPASMSASASAAPASTGPRTPNEAYARGTPTFVAGTLGDEHEDLVIRGQIEMIRGMLFPAAKVVDDTTIDVKGGAGAWPPNPVLYGGPQHNAVVAALESQLPFRMSSDGVEIDGRTLKGAGIQLITLVPARAGTLAHPSFMLYAGTGREGVAEINGMPHGESEIAIYDAFDSIAAGSWQRGAAGFTPQLNWAPARKALEDIDVQLGASPATIKLTLSTVKGATYEDLSKKQEAISRGLEMARKKLDITVPTDVRVVLYPNADAKKAFTHSAGNGHAAPAARTLHVVAFDERPLERLIAHEATHIFTAQLWGPPGTAFLGEGLAVWVSGQYGGVELVDWKKRLTTRTPLATLLGIQFRRLPEQETYPQAGLVAREIAERVGVAKLRETLWQATPQSWQAACERAGITAEQLDKLR
jgi:hypothetical protein